MNISVALCTYNGAKYLSDQLDSILNQSLPVDELIICDDKSTDATWALIESYQQRHPTIIKHFRNETSLGAVKNFESAIQRTTGAFIFLSDQDDIWHHDKVRIIISFFKKDPGALLVFTNGHLIDNNGEAIAGTLWEKALFNVERQRRWKKNKIALLELQNTYNWVTGATVAFRKELKDHIFPFNLPAVLWHDAWLSLVAAGLNGLKFLDEKLIFYRLHAAQQVGFGKTVKVDTSNDRDKNKISLEEFQHNVFKKFPKFRYLTNPPKKTLLGRIMNKTKREFMNVYSALRPNG